MPGSDKKLMPEWLIGCCIAIVLVVMLILWASRLGFGDNPLIG